MLWCFNIIQRYHIISLEFITYLKHGGSKRGHRSPRPWYSSGNRRRWSSKAANGSTWERRTAWTCLNNIEGSLCFILNLPCMYRHVPALPCHVMSFLPRVTNSARLLYISPSHLQLFSTLESPSEILPGSPLTLYRNKGLAPRIPLPSTTKHLKRKEKDSTHIRIRRSWPELAIDLLGDHST
jgi:hypothetical protein